MVQNIVNPNTYDQIERTKQIAQSARLQNLDLGTRLSQETRFQRTLAIDELQKLYDELHKTHNLSSDDCNAMLTGFSELKDGVYCIKVIRDMRQLGYQITMAQFATAIRAAAAARKSCVVYEIGEEMQTAGIQDTGRNYAVFFEQLVFSLSREKQPEHAYSVFLEMRDRGMVPSSDTYDALASSLASIGDPDLALEIILEAKARGVSLSTPTMLKVLHNAAVQMSAGPFKHCWEQLTTVMGVEVPEGDCDAGLNIAARTGDVMLAQSIVASLKKRGFPITECHFEALFDALVRDSQWPVALSVLNIMREYGYGKQSMTLRSMGQIIASHGAEKTEAIVDSIFNYMLKNKSTIPFAVDSVTLDALVSAVVISGKLILADNLFKQWYSQLSVKRTAESYDSLFRGCLIAKNKTLAETLLTTLIDTDKLKPTKSIYEQMILISLSQFNYEDAFVYLEAMKAQAMIPSWKTYSTLVRRCARVRDPRARVALKEMEDLGYHVTEALKSFADSHGRSARYYNQHKNAVGNVSGSVGSSSNEQGKKGNKEKKTPAFDIDFTV
ncbi:hypothetical protein FB645_002340 [Coemansia sp. IMI 203386]|nr:hypothetical protein FB645_002340 [Coemansia sp. IMI 203386]